MGILVLLLCFPVNSAYAMGPLDTVVNGIGDFFAWIIETIVSIFFAILDFFSNAIFGV